jgi:uncharacterized protein
MGDNIEMQKKSFPNVLSILCLLLLSLMQPNHRRCVSCRKVAHKESFWRIVRLYPSQAIQLDQGAGRSAYLCPNTECLQAAQKKNRLGRSLKAPVTEATYQILRQRLSDHGASFRSV